MNLCKYKDIFGKVNEGVHKYRFINLAVIDLTLTVAVALLISLFLSKINQIQVFIISFLILLISGIFLHRIFCVNTALNLLIFGKI